MPEPTTGRRPRRRCWLGPAGWGQYLFIFFAHIRAAIGSAVQQTNCHPFRHGRWLGHNGVIDGCAAVKRDLVLTVDESLFPRSGAPPTQRSCSAWCSRPAWPTTRPGSVARAIGPVEACGWARGVECPFQGTMDVAARDRARPVKWTRTGRRVGVLVVWGVGGCTSSPGSASALNCGLVACGPALRDLGLWVPGQPSLTMQS